MLWVITPRRDRLLQIGGSCKYRTYSAVRHPIYSRNRVLSGIMSQFKVVGDEGNDPSSIV
jgi:hypothetical protein